MVFDDLVVLDLSDGVAGQYAARLLTDYGARTTLVESSSGTGTRAHLGRQTDRRRDSALFHHLNAGKASRTVDWDDPEQVAALHAHLQVADVVVIDDIDRARSLREAHPSCVIGVVTEFGQGGPYETWVGSELVHQALSGSMFVNGLPGREPLYGFGHRAYFAAGTWLYIGVVAALIAKRRGSPAKLVEVSVHEAATSMEQNFATTWQYSGTIIRRGEEVRPRLRLECADGWLVAFVPKGHWRRLCEMLDAPALLTDSRFDRWDRAVRNITAATEAAQPYSKALTVAEALKRAENLEMLVAPIAAANTLLEDPHLNVRGYWQVANYPEGPRYALGPLFRPAGVAPFRDGVAPELGSPIGAGKESSERAPMAPEVPRGPELVRPLAGIRVLDLTVSWAGPAVTKVLASLGARVIKIEAPGRVDQWRGEVVNPYLPSVYPAGVPGRRSWNRNCWFNSQNHDKLSLVLDLKRSDAAAVIDRILPRVDLVVSNFSPGALDRLGLTFDHLVALNGRSSRLQMPAAGSDAPPLRRRGFGPTMEAMAGMTAYIGYDNTRPLGSGSSYLDPVGGLNGAAASLTAIYNAVRTGKGLDIELSQQEGAMQWAGDQLVEDIEAGAQRAISGNSRTDAVPHNAYECAGVDEWVAVACFNDNQWQALASVLQDPQLDKSWDLQARTARQPDIEAALSRWTRSRDKRACAASLQSAGVPAAPVQNGMDLTLDPHLRAVGWYRLMERPDLPSVLYPTSPLRLDGTRLTPTRLSPQFGQDTVSILRLDAGLSDAEIARLYETATTTVDPVVPS